MRRELKTFVVLTCITAATALGGSLASAESSSAPDHSGTKVEQQHHKGQRGHRFFKKIARELGLTAQQKVQAKALWENHRAQNKPLLEQFFSAKRDMRALVLSGNADEAAIRAESAKVAAVQADLAVSRAEGVKQFLALLTPDQVTKFKAMVAKHEQKFQNRRQEFFDR